MRLKYQLFLILLLTSGLLIALLALINSWSFDRGFIGYINDTERQRLEPLVDALAAAYVREGDWRWLTNDHAAWISLLDAQLRPERPPLPSDPRRTWPDRSHPPESDSRPVPMPGQSGSPPPPRPPGDAGSSQAPEPRLLLADADRQVLIGRDPGDQPVNWQPVKVDNRAVGYLGYRERERLPGRLDQAFSAQQRRGFLYAAIAMVLLSALFAVALAGRLARPLLAVNDAVARISRGQYTYRVPDARGDEIGDLSRSINTLAATLEMNLDARRQWLAEISHELRTPVAVLQGELEAIQDGVDQLDESGIASLHAETLRLARLIDDLHDLTLSDVGALDYRFERLDLREVVLARIATADRYSEAATLTITMNATPDLLRIDGDAQRLGQLMDNLLQNSLRYTDSPGKVEVALSRDRNLAIIDWSDSAPGVGEEQLARLFEPLYRADASRNRGRGGAGLGLAIVQRIVAAHHGTITANHASLGGLALHIELPLAADHQA